MSEPLSTSEIEDVLSSIRRLVSDDLRPAPVAAAPAAPAQTDSKLLLTPSLRVVQPEAEAEPDARAIDDVVAAVSAGVDQQGDDWEPETGDLSVETATVEIEADIWEDVPVIEEYAAPVAFVSSRTRDEVAAQSTPDMAAETIPEALAEVAVSDEIAQPLPAEDAPSDMGEPGFSAPEPEPELAPEPEQQATGPLPGWAQSQGADEAEVESRPDPVSMGTVEPDVKWADAAEAAILQELQGGAASASRLEPNGPDDFVLDIERDPEVPVDEAMLREIVRDVLREELQGRLGERITRNIRKLVRAEIARMMASEELF